MTRDRIAVRSSFKSLMASRKGIEPVTSRGIAIDVWRRQKTRRVGVTQSVVGSSLVSPLFRIVWIVE